MTPEVSAFLLQALEIIWINLLLSGDNAVVIALACRGLAPRERRWAVVLGAAAAVVLRVAFTLVIVELLTLPFLRLVCGLLLFGIAVKLLQDGQKDRTVAAPGTLWAAVRTVAAADAVMSLDNVMAIAAAAKGSGLLVLFGLALSIPLVVFGSTLMLMLLTRFPVLVWAGAALLGSVAADLVGSDPLVEGWLRHAAVSTEAWLAPLGAAMVVAVGLLRRRRSAAPRA
jgi:YjbE family integral membrane protein